MQENSGYGDILEDETLAPLKRNHACLQCKKRKVKCDAVRPVCNPCMRSHAHALRSAQRNKSSPPVLCCTYAEDDGDVPSEPEPERRRVSGGVPTSNPSKKQALGNGGMERTLQKERERRAAEERDTLKARIAELEERIAALTTSDSKPGPSPSYCDAQLSSTKSQPPPNGPWNAPMSAFPAQLASIDSSPSTALPLISIEAGAPGVFQSFDFSNLLVLPHNWPKNLPSPAVLEHLIETFFQCEPQLPRMIHRATLLSRIKLPPDHHDFPLPALLHAICAAASPHTAWMAAVSPEMREINRTRQMKAGIDLETSEDFMTSQCEAAERSIRHTAMCNMISKPQDAFDLVRAHIILAQNYLNCGMALRGWMTGGMPGRLIKALEIGNRNLRKSEKPPIMSDATSDREREERYATVWAAYISEAGFSSNACWSQSLQLREVWVPLPTSIEDFEGTYDPSTTKMRMNPQTAHDPDIFINHPVPDPYVLVTKSSILLGEVARWVYDWNQRDVRPGDDMEGLAMPSFQQIHKNIVDFQNNLPAKFKNIYRLVDSGNTKTFNADLLSIHVFPNMATLLLHEPFLEWEKRGPDTQANYTIQRAFETIMGIIHLIPTQLDVSHLFTPLLAFCMFTVGRFISRFVYRARLHEQYALAMRWRADLETINAVLQRYATKHTLGVHLQMYLANHIRAYEDGHKQINCIDAGVGTSPGGTPETDDVGRSSGPSETMGITPESVEAVDAATAHSTYHGPGTGTNSRMEPNPMPNMGGLGPEPLFDPTLLQQYFDASTVPQFDNNQQGGAPKGPVVPQSPMTEFLASLSASSMNGIGGPSVNIQGNQFNMNWNANTQFSN